MPITDAKLYAATQTMDEARHVEVFALSRKTRKVTRICANRKKDVVLRGGYDVYSARIEEVLIHHHGVATVAVIGLPHPVLGEEVCATPESECHARS